MKIRILGMDEVPVYMRVLIVEKSQLFIPYNLSEDYSGKKDTTVDCFWCREDGKSESYSYCWHFFSSPDYEGSWGLGEEGRQWVLGSDDVRKQNEIFDVVSRGGSLQENFIMFQEYVECLSEVGKRECIIILKCHAFCFIRQRGDSLA